MRLEHLDYIHLLPGAALPELSCLQPFKAVVIVESAVTSEWQAQVSSWLVGSGCRYMMAWGIECSSWDDSVDHASLDVFDHREAPDDTFVMTTWHEDQSLSDVFGFSKNWAHHPILELKDLVVVHISENERHDIEAAYENA